MGEQVVTVVVLMVRHKSETMLWWVFSIWYHQEIGKTKYVIYGTTGINSNTWNYTLFDFMVIYGIYGIMGADVTDAADSPSHHLVKFLHFIYIIFGYFWQLVSAYLLTTAETNSNQVKWTIPSKVYTENNWYNVSMTKYERRCSPYWVLVLVWVEWSNLVQHSWSSDICSKGDSHL